MSDGSSTARRPYWGLMTFAVALAFCLLLLPSVFVIVGWIRGTLTALTVADIFWMGWLPVVIYIGVRYFANLRRGHCPTCAPAQPKEQEP